MSAAASTAERRSVRARVRPNASRATIARQVSNQRSRYASAVLRSLARSQQGRPTPHIQHLLRNSLTRLGVRLPPAKLHQLATDIAAGRPVTLSGANGFCINRANSGWQRQQALKIGFRVRANRRKSGRLRGLDVGTLYA
jgi:hypothetical protein